MSDATLRAWLKPLAFTTSLGTAVGFPWEITRAKALKRDTVDIYAKNGALPGFTSHLLLLPGYGFGAVVLVAGLDGPAVSTLTEAVPFQPSKQRADVRCRAWATPVGFRLATAAGSRSGRTTDRGW